MVFPSPAHTYSLVVTRQRPPSHARTHRLVDQVVVRHDRRIATRVPKMAIGGLVTMPQLHVSVQESFCIDLA
jgi:hypothetical protein